MLTGYPILDRLTGGLGDGELMTVVGGPLAGRSMFALNMLRNQVDLEVADNIAFMTAELSVEEAEQKLLRMAVDEAEAGRMKGLFTFVDIVKFCPDFDSLRQKVVRLVRERGVRAVVIDSFHFLPFIGDYNYDKLPDISRRLKFLARELGIAIVVTSRTNYQPSERSGLCGQRPQLADLEYVGDLDYFSDVVLGLLRPELLSVEVDAEGNSMEGIIQVEILKSRKAVMQLLSYQLAPDRGLIKEKELLNRKDWLW